MWLSYLIARLAANGALGYSMFTTATIRVFNLSPAVLLMHGGMFLMAQGEGVRAPLTNPHPHPIALVCVAALNTMWFYKITVGLIKSLSGGSSGGAPRRGSKGASTGSGTQGTADAETDAPPPTAAHPSTPAAAVTHGGSEGAESALPAAPAPAPESHSGAAADGSSGGGLRRRHVPGSDAGAPASEDGAPSGSGGGGSARHQTAAVLHTSSYGSRRFVNRHDPTSDDFVREVTNDLCKPKPVPPTSAQSPIAAARAASGETSPPLNSARSRGSTGGHVTLAHTGSATGFHLDATTASRSASRHDLSATSTDAAAGTVTTGSPPESRRLSLRHDGMSADSAMDGGGVGLGEGEWDAASIAAGVAGRMERGNSAFRRFSPRVTVGGGGE